MRFHEHENELIQKLKIKKMHTPIVIFFPRQVLFASRRQPMYCDVTLTIVYAVFSFKCLVMKVYYC